MENQQPDTRAKPLTLSDMTSCFIVLALGYSISVFVFLLELIYDKITSRFFRHQVTKVHPISNVIEMTVSP